MVFRKILSLAAMSSVLFSGVYVVPQEYDNVVSSVKSKSFGVITQATATLSTNTYTIGGQNVKFRCLSVPKINCTAATPQVNANISESSLKRPSDESLLETFQLDIRVEEDANNWYLCGAGYGGQVWDDSTLTSTTVGSTTNVTYTYKPNSKKEEYYYFTDLANSSAQSYLTVTYSQMCQ